jgi:hypothetical protein
MSILFLNNNAKGTPYCIWMETLKSCFTVDSDMWLNNIQRTHSCIFMSTVAMRTRQCYVTCTLPIVFLCVLVSYGLVSEAPLKEKAK